MMDSHIIHNSSAMDLGVFLRILIPRTGSTEERTILTRPIEVGIESENIPTASLLFSRLRKRTYASSLGMGKNNTPVVAWHQMQEDRPDRAKKFKTYAEKAAHFPAKLSQRLQ